jgi:GTP-binding protein Era
MATVAFIGIPNAGKSTLTNSIVGSEVSIVTAKAQTTRERVLGIVTVGDTQLAIFDTPGTVAIRQQAKRRKRLQRSIVQEAGAAALSADVICLVVDAARTWSDDSEDQLRRLRTLHAQYVRERAEDESDDELARAETTAPAPPAPASRSRAARAAAAAAAATPDISQAPFILVMNKCDLVSMERARHKAHLIEQSGLFHKTFFVSAERNRHIDPLRSYLLSLAAPREWEFPAEKRHDHAPMQIVEEAIREQLLRRLNQELPYHIRQRNLGWTSLDDGSLRIDQYLLVDNLRVKRIVVGQSAKTIRVISERARKTIGERLGRIVHLFLTVKVEEPK